MNTVIGIAEYKKEDYPEIFELSEDKEQMYETWEEWKQEKAQKVKEFQMMGINPVDVIITPKELVKYCREKGLKINGEARSGFVSYKSSRANLN